MLLLAFLGTIAVVGIAAYLYFYFYVAPQIAVRHGITAPKEIAEFRDSLVKTPTQIIGGTIAVVPIAWTILSGIQTLKQSTDQAANQQFFSAAQMAVGGSEASDAKIDTTSDQLGVAANYALQKIALADRDYCSMVVNLLFGEIDENSKAQKAIIPNTRPPTVRAKISSAANVLGTILPCGTYRSIRLTNQYLVGANFGGANFGSADLRNMKLWRAYFGWAKLDKAKFDGAALADYEAFGDQQEFATAIKAKDWQYLKFDFMTNFEYADLRDASFLNTSVAGASFANADLACADFSNTNISRADFTGAKNLNLAIFKNACFEGPTPAGLGDLSAGILRDRKDCTPLASTPTPPKCQQINARYNIFLRDWARSANP